MHIVAEQILLPPPNSPSKTGVNALVVGEGRSGGYGDFAIAAVGCLITLDTNGTIGRAALCVSGLGPAPVRVGAAERLLTGERPSHEVIPRRGRSGRGA